MIMSYFCRRRSIYVVDGVVLLKGVSGKSIPEVCGPSVPQWFVHRCIGEIFPARKRLPRFPSRFEHNFAQQLSSSDLRR